MNVKSYDLGRLFGVCAFNISVGLIVLYGVLGFAHVFYASGYFPWLQQVAGAWPIVGLLACASVALLALVEFIEEFW